MQDIVTSQTLKCIKSLDLGNYQLRKTVWKEREKKKIIYDPLYIEFQLFDAQQDHKKVDKLVNPQQDMKVYLTG